MNDRPKLPPQIANEIVQALSEGRGLIHYARCWGCMTDQHPGGHHAWADDKDIEHAAKTGKPSPAGEPCSCSCYNEPERVPEPWPEPDFLEVPSDDNPCPVCGAVNECGADSDGRPMIHTFQDDDNRGDEVGEEDDYSAGHAED